MTKFTTILTSALLASSALAISANASSKSWDNDFDDIKVKVQKRASGSATKAEVFVTNDSRKIELGTLPSGHLKVKAPLKKGEVSTLSAPKIDFKTTMPRHASNLGTTDQPSKYDDAKYKIDTSKPGLVQYSLIAIHADQNKVISADKELKGVKSELIIDRTADDFARNLDVVNSQRQDQLLDAREEAIVKSKLDLEHVRDAIKALNDAYNSVYNTDTLMNRKTKQDYWTALNVAKEANHKARPVHPVRPMNTVATADEAYNAADIAQAAIPSIDPSTAVARQKVTKQEMIEDMKDHPMVITSNLSEHDASLYLSRKASLNKQQREVAKLSEEVAALLAATEASKMWFSYYKPILDGKATFNVPTPVAEPVAEGPANKDAVADTAATEEVVGQEAAEIAN